VEHAFGTGEPFSVGIEEELLLVDAQTHALAHVAEDLLPRIELPEGRADYEAHAAEVELRSPPSADAAAAVAALEEGRRATLAAGATLMGSGLHPAAALGDVRLVMKPRYEGVEREMRGLIKRTPECALHTHVGVPDADAAVAALRGLRDALPLLQGLGANSPFWFGADSGMASARAAVVREYPGRGVPPAFETWDEYLEAVSAAAAGGGPGDYSLLWWDVRLHPRLGTVELREIDAQTSLDDIAGLAALAQAIARRSAESPAERPAHSQALAWSCFNAARDGLDARIQHRGSLMPLRAAARDALDSLGDGDPALERVERILRDGGGADRQRAAHSRGGMPVLLAELVQGTRDGRRPAGA
jgi:glutamate---cysteine ligase / carboxylate-amine ligase